ncbi:MAG: sulfatase [Verrucomicrobia bacterium]|nr:sulfatase [Verrucomicrobiota bacterium]
MKRTIGLLIMILLLMFGSGRAADTARRPNIVFITADDMNFDSSDVYGGPIKNLTPNLDRLAADGMRFHYAYSTVAVCQPVREIMHTGLYPHRNGAMGFFPLKPEVRTLNQQLHDAGYLISMFGKNPHYQPAENFCVDYAETRISRSPSQLAAATKKFLTMARDKKRPFFHHVNCTDPHRPFIGANGPDDLAGGDPPSRWIKPEEVVGVPGFLENLPLVRRELAQYFTNVRRLDDCVGAVLKALKDEGANENTLVMFYGGDHGMSFPFAKSNDYENSSRGALILRWPGVIKPGGVDRDHLVSTLDFTPTLLDATGLPAIPDIDGRSFLPAMNGGKMRGWDRVFTFYNQTSGRLWLLMRCIRTKDRSYIWNAWSDGKMQYRAENMGGLTWKAMLAAAETHPAIKARADFYLYRVPEEFYDMTQDRFERHNLIKDPSRQAEIESFRKELRTLMQRTGDPLAEAFAHRDKPEFLAAAKQKLMEEYERPPKGKNKAKKAAAKAGKTSSAAEDEKKLIAFILPKAIVATEPVTLRIAHHFADKNREQAITVTMLAGAGKARLERKVVKAKGDGEIEVTFSVPAEQSGKAIKFAAFVGEDFKKTPLHIQSAPLTVK